MVRALFPTSSVKLRVLNAASWALMPFQPTAVSTANIGIAEVGLGFCRCTSVPLYRTSYGLLPFSGDAQVERNAVLRQVGN